MIKSILTSAALSALVTLGACSQATQAADKAAAPAADKVVQLAQNAAMGMGTGMGNAMAAPAADIPTDLSLLSAGTYISDDTHEYIAFDYLHQGYSNPILTWDEIDAKIDLNPSNLEASSLSVSIPTTSINTGVPIWDERLQNDTFFDAAGHPAITFNSTSLNMVSKTKGTVTGDLTIKGTTKPVTLNVTLNKVGKHFRSGKDHFGISATGSLNRSDWGLSTGLPATSDNVNLRIEVEFGKE